MSYWSQPQILCLPSPYVPIVGVPLYSDRLKTYTFRLVMFNGNGLSGRQRVA